MAPDYSPEALADKMSAEQRINQFEIRDPAPVWEVVLILAALIAALTIVHYHEPIEIWLAGWGI